LFRLSSGEIHEEIINSIRKCDSEIMDELSQNIILAEGYTNFPGFQERFENENNSKSWCHEKGAMLLGLADQFWDR
jgi:hypothetical protein